MKRSMKLAVLLVAGLLIILTAVAFFQFNNYPEPTTGVTVSAGIEESGEQLAYWFETDFIPRASYTVSITLHLPLGTNSFEVVPLKETTFKADDTTKRFQDVVSVQDIKDKILSLENEYIGDKALVAENWRDYEYVVSMHRTKFWKTYESLGIPSKLEKE